MGKLFIYAMLVQFWVYLSLSICILITLLGAYYAGCRCFNAFVHTLGLFAHVFAVAYLGTTRFSKAGKLCSSEKDAPLYTSGQFLYNMFIV